MDEVHVLVCAQCARDLGGRMLGRAGNVRRDLGAGGRLEADDIDRLTVGKNHALD
jgi:hypothetical protein